MTPVDGIPPVVPMGKLRRFRLVEDYFFTSGSKVIKINNGFTYDGASIPSIVGLTWALTYSPFDPCVMRAALVHDWFCDHRPMWFKHDDAAELFRKHLLLDGAGNNKAWMMYQAVLRFGPRW